MKLTEAYTVYNNSLQAMNPALAEAINFILDDKDKQLEKLDQVELAEVKTRIEMEAVDGYYSALLKKRVQQVEVLQSENHRLRTGIVELREYIGYQPHSDLAENVVDILYKILNDEAKVGESNAI